MSPFRHVGKAKKQAKNAGNRHQNNGMSHPGYWMVDHKTNTAVTPLITKDKETSGIQKDLTDDTYVSRAFR